MKSLKKLNQTTFFLIALSLVISSCGTSSSEKKMEVVKTPSIDLIGAVFMGNYDAVLKHIEAGTDLNTKDQFGSAPLHVAATFGRDEIAAVLIEAGADVNLTNAEGSTPLHLASFFCQEQIVKDLLAVNSNKEIRNNYGATAFESVSGPFESVRPIYMQIEKDMGALGIKFDYDRLEQTRPVIAELLQ